MSQLVLGSTRIPRTATGTTARATAAGQGRPFLRPVYCTTNVHHATGSAAIPTYLTPPHQTRCAKSAATNSSKPCARSQTATAASTAASPPTAATPGRRSRYRRHPSWRAAPASSAIPPHDHATVTAALACPRCQVGAAHTCRSKAASAPGPSTLRYQHGTDRTFRLMPCLPSPPRGGRGQQQRDGRGPPQTASEGLSASNRASSPLTNPGEESVESRLASSTASSSTTPSGTSARHSSS